MLAKQPEKVFDAAMMYARAGLSVFPAYKNKRPAVKWTRCQELITNEVTIRKWFAPGRYNVAIVGGAVSGGLVILDFDYDADEIFPAWIAFLETKVKDLAPRFPVVQTGKGYHVYFRCDVPGNNRKLASDGDGRTLIETRGEGGYVLGPPSKHENGKTYTLIQGDLEKIPFLNEEQARIVFDSCDFFNVATEATAVPEQPVTNNVATEAAAAAAPGITTDIRQEIYIAEAFNREAAAVKSAAPGSRNNQLFKSTAALAGLVAGGLVSADQVRNLMLDAAGDLLHEEPEQTRKTIASAMTKGSRTPRRLPPPPPPPAPAVNGSGPKPAKEAVKPKQRGTLNVNLKHPKTGDFRKALEWLGYEFRLNELDDTIEVNQKPIDDGIAAVIRNRMRDIGLNSVPWVTDTFVHVAYENTYHPIKEYFDGLKWDGGDHIGHFTGQYLTETTGLGHAAFKRWFIGAVAKVYEQSQNFMLVWDGKQGIGKSVLARWLCPLPDYFIEGPIKPDDKDFQLRMCTKLVWEVSELQSTTRKADREALKGFITTKEVTVRKAYARYDTVKPSLVSMVGTINEDGAGFLTDPTGNRRFVIIRIDDIDWGYAKLDITKLWAQAVALYRQGEAWQLTREETELQNSINAQYEMTSVLSTYFFEFYRVDPTNKEAFELTYEMLQTLETAGLKGSQQANLNELGRLLRKLGAEPFRAKVGGKRPSAFRGVMKIEPAKLSI